MMTDRPVTPRRNLHSSTHRTALALALLPALGLGVSLVTGPAIANPQAELAGPAAALPTTDTGEDGTPNALRFSHVDLPTGVRLHVAEQGDPRGEAILLLHGYTDSWFSFSRVLPLLPSRFRVLAIDQRGHGDSSRPTGDYALETLAADVLALMDALGLPRATIVGHSMGSLVAQQVALAAPERVSRLVLIGAVTAGRRIEGVDDLRLAVEALADPVPETFVREFQESTIHAPLPPEFLARVIAESSKLPARVWQALMVAMLATDLAPRLGRVEVPTLVLWGDREAITPRAEQKNLVRLIHTARLAIYPDTGHALHWERPEAFARDLVGFVAGE